MVPIPLKSAVYTLEKINFCGAGETGGYGFDKARYFEAEYTFFKKGGYTAPKHMSVPEMKWHRLPGMGDYFALVNIGVTVSKVRQAFSMVNNPDRQKTWFVVKASF